MNIEPKKVWVVGHKNPDTDSICAAISYAYLKNQLGERQYVPKRAGAISEETRYVLDYFKVEDPELITDVGAQLKDISIRKTAGISSQISLEKSMGNHEKVRCRNTSGDKPAWKVRGCDRNKGYCNLLHGCL